MCQIGYRILDEEIFENCAVHSTEVRSTELVPFRFQPFGPHCLPGVDGCEKALNLLALDNLLVSLSYSAYLGSSYDPTSYLLRTIPFDQYIEESKASITTCNPDEKKYI